MVAALSTMASCYRDCYSRQIILADPYSAVSVMLVIRFSVKLKDPLLLALLS